MPREADGHVDCRGVGKHGGRRHDELGLRPVCAICYANLLRTSRREHEELRAARLEADKLRRELEDAHRLVRESALALGRIVEG